MARARGRKLKKTNQKTKNPAVTKGIKEKGMDIISLGNGGGRKRSGNSNFHDREERAEKSHQAKDQ